MSCTSSQGFAGLYTSPKPVIFQPEPNWTRNEARQPIFEYAELIYNHRRALFEHRKRGNRWNSKLNYIQSSAKLQAVSQWSSWTVQDFYTTRCQVAVYASCLVYVYSSYTVTFKSCIAKLKMSSYHIRYWFPIPFFPKTPPSFRARFQPSGRAQQTRSTANGRWTTNFTMPFLICCLSWN